MTGGSQFYLGQAGKNELTLTRDTANLTTER
jgi:hypothetical protein